ncbi:Fe-S protein assembly co-chaperone HscB [bacterium]|nr:Fe-S protein assembly co-chaperone HscB [bacterium]
MDDFFQFYGLERKLQLDDKELRLKYLDLSKKFHPDFFANNPEGQVEALQKTSLNNRAYNALKTLNGRVKHVLELEGLLEEKGGKIPQEFLMEMMDLNESLMELQFDFDKAEYEKIKGEFEAVAEGMDKALESAAARYDGAEDKAEILQEILEIYLKQKYLLRIKETLSKFAHL